MNFIYLQNTKELINLNFIKSISEKFDGCTEFIDDQGNPFTKEESFDYVKELVYEAQFKQEKE